MKQMICPECNKESTFRCKYEITRIYETVLKLNNDTPELDLDKETCKSPYGFPIDITCSNCGKQIELKEIVVK